MKRVVIVGLLLGLSIGLAFAKGPGHGIDWQSFRQWSLGFPYELGIWNPHWLKLFTLPLAYQPQDVGHALLNLLTFASISAVGHYWPLLSYVFLDYTWVGNIDVLVVLGIILARCRNPHAIGTGLFLQSVKPQYMPLSFYYIWRHKDYRIFVVPLIGFLLSLIVYGNWLSEWIATLPPEPIGANVSFYPWTLPVWLLLPFALDKERFILSATIVSSPYFNQVSIITLFAFQWSRWAAIIIIVLSWINPSLIGLFAVIYAIIQSPQQQTAGLLPSRLTK